MRRALLALSRILSLRHRWDVAGMLFSNIGQYPMFRRCKPLDGLIWRQAKELVAFKPQRLR